MVKNITNILKMNLILKKKVQLKVLLPFLKKGKKLVMTY